MWRYCRLGNAYIVCTFFTSVPEIPSFAWCALLLKLIKGARAALLVSSRQLAACALYFQLLSCHLLSGVTLHSAAYTGTQCHSRQDTMSHVALVAWLLWCQLMLLVGVSYLGLVPTNVVDRLISHLVSQLVFGHH